MSGTLEATSRHDAAFSQSAAVPSERGSSLCSGEGTCAMVAWCHRHQPPSTPSMRRWGSHGIIWKPLRSAYSRAGLEGHVLPEKVAMVRQRLFLEQNRLAAGAAAVTATVSMCEVA